MYLLSSITGSVGSPSRSRRLKLGSGFLFVFLAASLSSSLSLSISLSLVLPLNSRELSPPPRLLIFADNYRTGDPFNSASLRPRHVREIDSKRPCFLPCFSISDEPGIFSTLSHYKYNFGIGSHALCLRLHEKKERNCTDHYFITLEIRGVS